MPIAYKYRILGIGNSTLVISLITLFPKGSALLAYPLLIYLSKYYIRAAGVYFLFFFSYTFRLASSSYSLLLSYSLSRYSGIGID